MVKVVASNFASIMAALIARSVKCGVLNERVADAGNLMQISPGPCGP